MRKLERGLSLDFPYDIKYRLLCSLLKVLLLIDFQLDQPYIILVSHFCQTVDGKYRLRTATNYMEILFVPLPDKRCLI